MSTDSEQDPTRPGVTTDSGRLHHPRPAHPTWRPHRPCKKRSHTECDSWPKDLDWWTFKARAHATAEQAEKSGYTAAEMAQVMQLLLGPPEQASAKSYLQCITASTYLVSYFVPHTTRAARARLQLYSKVTELHLTARNLRARACTGTYINRCGGARRAGFFAGKWIIAI